MVIGKGKLATWLMLTCFLRQPDQEMSEESETVAGDDFQLLKHSRGKPGEGSFL